MRSCSTTRTTGPGAKQQLQWVVDHAGEDELKAIARFRLAQALLDEKNYDEALKTIDVKTDDAFVAIYADLRGDILASAGKKRRGARRVPDCAGQDGSQVAVPPLRAGQARFARGRAMTAGRAGALVVAALLLGGCQTLPESWTSWLPSSLPTPSLAWLGLGSDKNKPGPLPAYQSSAIATVKWQVALGVKGGANFAPAVLADVIYASAPDGTIVSVDPVTGRQNWRIKADKPLQAGVGASLTTVAVGTQKGEVLAFDNNGKPLWQAKVSSEVAGPPKSAEGKIIVWSIDGRIFAFAETDGSQKWVYQRTSPSADRAPFRRRHAHPRRPVYRHRRRQAARARREQRDARLGGQCRDAQGSDRARTHRRRHQPAGGGREAGLRGRVPGSGRVLRAAARHAALVARLLQPRRSRVGRRSISI